MAKGYMLAKLDELFILIGDHVEDGVVSIDEIEPLVQSLALAVDDLEVGNEESR